MLSKKISLFFITLFVLSTVFVFNPNVTKAETLPEVSVRDEAYAAQYISQTIKDPVKIEAGSTVTVDVKFKNVGTATWNANSANFVSAFTMEPRYHESDFAGGNWRDKTETAKMSPSIVKPGEYGTLSVQIKAPEKTGTYTEKFWLASQYHSWVKGGYFYLVINVVPKTTATVEKPATETKTEEVSTPATTTETAYKAKKFFVNVKEIKAEAASRVKVILGLQNLGTATWSKYSLIANTPASVAGSTSNLSFADSSWKGSNTILENNSAVAQWGSTRDEFTIVTPSKQGKYNLTLKVKADGKDVEGVEINVPVEVTSNAPGYVPPFSNNSDSNSFVGEVPRLAEEPRIRVGVWQNPEDGVQFKSADDDYSVFAGGVLYGTLSKNSLATMSYQNGVYKLSAPGIDISSNDYIRLTPQTNMHAVFTLVNYDREVSWKGPVNFNKYRGAMELRKINNGDDVYVIEEVLMEDYVAGIAETSNAGPTEYIKALLTAARTYAYYVANYSTKHDTRNFDVVAHTGDQLYLGYQSEVLMPNVVAAQKATRGYMITYNNEIVITPYFANSDGYTRSWTEVWGGSTRPWLVSIKSIYDLRDSDLLSNKKVSCKPYGSIQCGHGVGMSARDAAYMADEGGASWQEILHHYYTSVDINLIYR